MKPTRSATLPLTICFTLLGFLNRALGLTLVALTNAPVASNGWQCVACSADGTQLVACAYHGSIYTSTDSGATWVSNAAPVKYWNYVASSADGTKLAATATSGSGQVWTNSGTTWYPTTSPTAATAMYGSVACSADGTKLVTSASFGGFPKYYVLLSPDSGATWKTASLPNNVPWVVSSSSDGRKLVAVGENSTLAYTSTDSGTTWTSNSIPYFNWFSVCSSADGSKLVAVAMDGGSYRSWDSGTTWVSNNVPHHTWYSVASSSDGSKIVAVGIYSLYTSTNFGQTWISNNWPAALLGSVACSTNGLLGIADGATGPTSPVLYGFAPDTMTPPLLSFISSNSQFAVAWPSSVTGFQLQQNTNLSTANWSNVLSPVVISNGMNEVIISPSNASTFYRLKVSQ